VEVVHGLVLANPAYNSDSRVCLSAKGQQMSHGVAARVRVQEASGAAVGIEEVLSLFRLGIAL